MIYDIFEPNLATLNTTAPEVVTLKGLLDEASDQRAELMRSNASKESIDEVDRLVERLVNETYEAALNTGKAESTAKQAEEHARRLDEQLSKPMEDNIQRALWALKKYGPMTATDLSAHRLPGLSHNYVRPVLDLARSRGLVERQQAGRRVIWSLAP